jgi:hypothetical protein
MQYARAMRDFERTRELHADADRLAPVKGSMPADHRLQRILGVVGHHDERPATGQDADLKNLHDMRVSRKAAHDPLLAQEAGKIVRVKIGGQHLDRNRTVQHRLGAAVDDAKAATTDLLDVVEFRLAQFRGDVSD